MRYEFRWCGDLKLYQIRRESRQVASHWYGPPSRRSIPFSPIRDVVHVMARSIVGEENWGYDLRLERHPYGPYPGADPIRSVSQSTDLIPRSLLCRSHRVFLDMTPVAEWQDFRFSATHHRQNVLDFAKYVRDTFYSVRHLTFSFLPVDDCVLRPPLHEKGETHHLDGNWGGYNPLQHHVYSAVRIGLLEVFSGLSRKPTLNKLPRPNKPNRLVPFPKLRTLELEWEPLICRLFACTQHPILEEEQVEEVQTNAASRWTFWIRVDNDYVPRARDIVPALKSLVPRRPLIPLEAYITTNPDKDGMREADDFAPEPLEGFHGRGVLDDPLDDPLMWQTISGDPGSDFYFSSLEPGFYLHHGNIDRLHFIWQNLDWEKRQTIAGTGTMFNSPPSATSKLTDNMGFELLNRNITIGAAMDTVGGSPLCYIYEPW
ncbi:hypothetical protein V8F33_009472 [Rhypophila sp. PSN 637]